MEEFMKRLTTALLIAVLAIGANAQEFKYSGQLRTRAAMYSLKLSENGDNSVMNRQTDLRFRPQFECKVNDQLNVVWRAEIGDITFGTQQSKILDKDGKPANVGQSSGGQQGTDGVNVETKSLYLDYKPNEAHLIRIGLQNYYDPMLLILEDDFAGITYTGKFDNLTAKAGWLISTDDGEKNINESTYGFGIHNLVFDFSYAVDKNLKFGLNEFTQLASFNVKNTDSLAINMNATGMWFAPYVNATMLDGTLKIDGEFSYFMGSSEYDYVINKNNVEKEENPKDRSGMALMLKSGYKVNDQLSVGFNFLYASGNDTHSDSTNVDAYYEYYQAPYNGTPISKYTELGLEIMGTNGSYDAVGLDLAAITSNQARRGIMLPVFYGNYAIDNNYTIGAAFGYGMTAADYEYMKDGATEPTKESALGMEFDLNAKIKLGEKLMVTPYAAFFMPSDGFQVAKSSGTGTETAPMKQEIGLKAELKF